MIPVSKYSGRLGERVRLVVIHSSEGARDVATLAAYLNRPGVQASYHGAVDDQRYEAYVNYSNACWALRNGNQESDNLCLCAFASWTRSEWLEHPRMLELTAAWIADRCRARGLPIVLLADREVGNVMRNDAHPGGVCDHDAYTKGTGDGTHWDVGENFPFDFVMKRAEELAMPTAQQIADAVWQRPVVNLKGEKVDAQYILAASENRAADIQQQIAKLRTEVDSLKTALAQLSKA